MAATVISRVVLGSMDLIVASGTTPEGSVAAAPGSILLSEGGLLYTKSTGTGNTGWVTSLPSDGVLSTVLSGLSLASAADITAASTVLEAFGQLQAQLNAQEPSFLVYSGGSQAFSALTLADVNSTTFTFPSTGMYEVEYYISYDAAISSTGAWFSLNGTVVFDYMSALNSYSTAAGDRSTFQYRTFNAGVPMVSSLLGAGNNCLVYVTINVTTVGTIFLRAATEINASAITVTNVLGYMRKKH